MPTLMVSSAGTNTVLSTSQKAVRHLKRVSGLLIVSLTALYP